MYEWWGSFDLKTKDCSRQGCPRLGSPSLAAAQSFWFPPSWLVDTAALNSARVQPVPCLCLSCSQNHYVCAQTLHPPPMSRVKSAPGTQRVARRLETRPCLLLNHQGQRHPASPLGTFIINHVWVPAVLGKQLYWPDSWWPQLRIMSLVLKENSSGTVGLYFLNKLFFFF